MFWWLRRILPFGIIDIEERVRQPVVDASVDSCMFLGFVFFPARESSTGKLINDYLEQKSELDDHVIHLLFSANRWEAVWVICQVFCIVFGITCVNFVLFIYGLGLHPMSPACPVVHSSRFRKFHDTTRVARPPIFYGISRISALVSYLPEESHIRVDW